MIYIVCDMNCNNFGNYFRILGLERELKQNKGSYIIKNTYYPKGHCYRVRLWFGKEYYDSILYSKAIDYLFPKDYMRWKKNRFGGIE